MWAVSSSGLTSALMRLSSPIASAFSSQASSSLALRLAPGCAFGCSSVVASAPAFTEISTPPLLYLRTIENGSQLRFKVDGFDGCGNFSALCGDCIGKLFRSTNVDDLTGGF